MKTDEKPTTENRITIASLRRRERGVFYISRHMLDEREHIIPDILCLMEFVPYRVEFLLSRNALELIGTSPLFDVLRDGEIAPGYEIEISTDSDGSIKDVKAVRK